ncbi:hypothetical protein EES43_09365 [Streptomyces sp. ADI96-02]|uniref:hypothetical protein n=1 Tax=unclassified Streptomyces TaxID=2593676 RepID=UPI000F55587E|nr:hypothetical protein [Streptomyces sp. ADI96-02]RPK64563.1 hypothetical protein EES43_09365 [Streptomyces sp. ADI96-02]
MKHAIARLLKPVLRLLIPVRRQRHPLDTYAYVSAYSCSYVGGPTVYRTGERPPRGEDSPLVRPYFVAHERQVAEARAAEARRRRIRRGGLLVAVRGVDLRRVKEAVA